MIDEDVARLIVGAVGQPVVLTILQGRHTRGNLPSYENYVRVCLVRQQASTTVAGPGDSPACTTEPTWPATVDIHGSWALPPRNNSSGTLSSQSQRLPDSPCASGSFSSASAASTQGRAETPDAHDAAHRMGGGAVAPCALDPSIWAPPPPAWDRAESLHRWPSAPRSDPPSATAPTAAAQWTGARPAPAALVRGLEFKARAT